VHLQAALVHCCGAPAVAVKCDINYKCHFYIHFKKCAQIYSSSSCI
jgi:hypothetical protein